MHQLKIVINKKKILDIVMFLFMCFTSIRVPIYIVTGFPGLSFFIMYSLLYGALVCYFAYSRRFFEKKSLIVFSVVVVFFAITCLTHPEYHSLFFDRSNVYGKGIILNEVFTFRSGIFILLFLCLYNDAERLLKVLKISSYVNVFFIVYRLIAGSYTYVVDANMSSSAYSMSFGYDIIFPFIIFVYTVLTSKSWFSKILHSVISLSLLVLLFANASRGVFLCMIIFVFLYLMFGIDFKYKRSTQAMIVLLTILAAHLVLNTSLLMDIGRYLSNIGIESRIVDSLLSSAIGEDNGREVIWLAAVMHINDGGWFGQGFCAARYLYSGNYPHNIFLEMLIDMGKIGGILIIAALFVGIVRVIKNVKDYTWRNIFIIFVSCALGRLLFSGTFWTETYFWGALASGIAAINDGEQRNKGRGFHVSR